MIFFVQRLNGPGVDRQRVNVTAHEFSGGSIDHSMSLYLRHAVEGGRGDRHVKMATFAGTGVTDVFGTVIANLEHGRMQRLFERGAQALDARRIAHAVFSLLTAPRSIQNNRPSVVTMAKGVSIQTLNVTQSASERFSATQMFANPKTMFAAPISNV